MLRLDQLRAQRAAWRGRRPSEEPEQRPQRNAAATRQRILDAAEREFAARGFAGARLREIADGAGIQPALIHHYFADKQGLYQAVLDRALLECSRMSWSILASASDVEGLVRSFVHMLVDFHAEHDSLLAILRHEAASGGGLAAPLLRERVQPVAEAVALAIREQQQAGLVRPDVDASEIILAAIAMSAYPFAEASLIEPAMPGAASRDPAALARRKAAIERILLDGLRL